MTKLGNPPIWVRKKKKKPLAATEKVLLMFNNVDPQSSQKNMTLAVSLEKIMPELY